MQDTIDQQTPQPRKGLAAAAYTHAIAADALERINAELVSVAAQIAEANPATSLRPQKMRRDNRKLAGSAAAARILGRTEQPTSALRLRLNACGAPTCTGCPHPHFGVWRAYSVGGEIKKGMSEVKTSVQLLAYARHAADPERTTALVTKALALIARRDNLVQAFQQLGRVARANAKA